jgi:hypothetical protein
MRKLIALVALAPSLALAAPKLPAWTLVEGNACYSFDDAKKLKVMEAECVALDATIPPLRGQIGTLQGQLAVTNKATVVLKDANTDLSDQLKKAQTERDAAIEKAIVADQWSLKGGGLPWVIAAGATALVVGIVFGLTAK